MLPLTQQVSSLELSRRLQELGVKQESFFTWEVKFGKVETLIWNDFHKIPFYDTSDLRQYYPAFTVAELGAMLRQEEYECPERCVGGWEWKEWHGGGLCTIHTISEQPDTQISEADARAKMLIYLLEQGLLTL